MNKAKMKIKPNADRQMDDIKHKLAALVLVKHMRDVMKPKRKGGLTKSEG